jgi:hypothetical protein
LVCPVTHSKFFQQKGCNYLLRINPNIRLQIPYGSGSFRQLYRDRTAVERAFSRLLTIAMQDLPTRGLGSARNLCTIAHYGSTGGPGRPAKRLSRPIGLCSKLRPPGGTQGRVGPPGLRPPTVGEIHDCDGSPTRRSRSETGL